MPLARGEGRDWVIVDVGERTGARSGIAGKLVDRGEDNPRMVRDDVLSPVAMVGVEIPNRHAFRPIFQSIERRYGDVAVITKAHRANTGGMMAGWPHQTEGPLAPQRSSRRLHRRGRRAHRVLVNSCISGSVGIEIICRG